MIFLAMLLAMAAGGERHEMKVGDATRVYRLDSPPTGKAVAGVILVFHGYTDSAESVREYTGFAAAASKYGFVVAYPEGLIDRFGKSYFNVGYEFLKSTVDDVAFAHELATTLTRQYRVSPAKVFATGMSNGGDMSFFLACQKKPFVQAIAPVAGTMMASWAADANFAVPQRIFAVNATADKVTLWEGDMANRDGWGAYLGTDRVIQTWVAGLRAKPIGASKEQVLVGNEWLSADHPAWVSADGKSVVQQVKIQGGSHTWPSKIAKVPTWEAICRFFLRPDPRSKATR